MQDIRLKELRLAQMKERLENEAALAAAMQAVERTRRAPEQVQNARAGEEAGFAEEAARKEAEWAESNAKLGAEYAEKIRQAEDDILKATQAVRELDSAWLADPSWSHRDEEAFRRFEAISRQRKENSSWQRVDSVRSRS